MRGGLGSGVRGGGDVPAGACGINAVWIVAVAHLFTACAILPAMVYLDVWPSGSQWLVLAAFGFIQMALPYVFFARGLQSVTSQEATGIGLLEPLLLPVWVYLAWSEVPARLDLGGWRVDSCRPGLALLHPVDAALNFRICGVGPDDQIAAQPANQMPHFQRTDGSQHLRRWQPAGGHYRVDRRGAPADLG